MVPSLSLTLVLVEGYLSELFASMEYEREIWRVVARKKSPGTWCGLSEINLQKYGKMCLTDSKDYIMNIVAVSSLCHLSLPFCNSHVLRGRMRWENVCTHTVLAVDLILLMLTG